MSKEKKENVELVWHDQQENILKKWGEIGSSYRFMHDRAFLKYEAQNLRFALPVIILYEVSILISRFLAKKKKNEKTEDITE